MGVAFRGAVAVAVFVLLAAAVPEGDDRQKKDAGRFINGQLLVAAPNAPDGRFAKTVILMVRHNAKGAFGLIVNRRIGKISAARLLEQLGKDPKMEGPPSGDITLHFGGPVASNRVFVVHSADFKGEATTKVNPSAAVTTSADVLRAIATKKGPKESIVALGYSGWGAGQLEKELKRNFWVVVPFDERIVLDNRIDTKWKRALARQGVDL